MNAFHPPLRSRPGGRACPERDGLRLQVVAEGWPEYLAWLGLGLWLACFWSGPLINDVGWQLWIGRQLNAGATLYVDILEINPPLWFWFGAVVQRVSALSGIGGLQVLTLAFTALAILSVWLCRSLIPNPRERAGLYAALLLTLFLTSIYAHGQREQFTLLATFPYIALIAARSERRTVSARLAVTIALVAALGLALKHYFVLLPLFLEAWLVWRERKVAVRPELLTLAAVGTAYAASIPILTPDYLTTMVPLISDVYRGFDQSVLTLVRHPPLYAAILAVVILRVQQRQVPALAHGMAIAALGFSAAFLAQAKGFEYHAVPILGTALASLFVLLFSTGSKHPTRGHLLGAAVLACAAVTPILAGPARFDQAGVKATGALPTGASITVLSTSGHAAWPLVEERRFTWSSRHMMLWMAGPVWLHMDEDRVTLADRRLAARIRSEVATEIACSRPAMVLVDQRYDHLIPGGTVLSFFQQDPAFGEAMRDYRRAPDVEYLQVWRRLSPTANRPRPSRC